MSTSEYQDVPPINIKKHGFQELDGAGRAVELQEQGTMELQAQSVQELDHPVPAVELQAHGYYSRNRITS